MRAHHSLKTQMQYYHLTEEGKKSFEVRKNDRNFKKGDMVTLQEWFSGDFTGRSLGPFEISYILEGGQFGIEDGYCVFQLKK